MDKIQKIKQEIERRIDLYSIAEKDDSTFSRMGELSSLIDFINSLPEEPASEDLENQYKSNMCYQHAYTQDNLMKTKSEDLEEEINKVDDWYPVEIQYIREIARHFAEWQKQKDFQDFLGKAEEFLYLQLNNGSIECGNIERLIDDFKNYMEDESEN